VSRLPLRLPLPLMLLPLALAGSGCGPVAPADDDDATAATFVPEEGCPDPADGRQDVVETNASPYYVSHPEGDLQAGSTAPVVLFMPGGFGSVGHSTGTWNGFLTGAEGLDRYRVVMPYAPDGDFTDEWERAEDVLAEVLACFGGDPDRVHLVGHSNGGWEALELLQILPPDTFATAVVAPGYFLTFDADLVSLGEGRARSAVGANDEATWHTAAEQTVDRFEEVGVDVDLELMDGVGHTPGATWGGGDDLLFDFFDG